MAALLDEVRALVLLGAANGIPVVVGKLARDRWNAPLDFGYLLRDRRRLFGAHKTWRGFVSGMCACGIAAVFFKLPFWIGAGFAAVSLLADAISSAIKRRLNLAPGKETIGLDQLGETFMPLIVFAKSLSLDAIDVAIVGVAFIFLDLATAPLRSRRWRR